MPTLDAGEAVAGGADHAPFDVDVDVVPMRECARDLGLGLRVGAGQILERPIGEDDAPAEGVGGPVALEDRDFVAPVLLLHQDREVEAGGPAADDGNPHRRRPPVAGRATGRLHMPRGAREDSRNCRFHGRNLVL